MRFRFYQQQNAPAWPANTWYRARTAADVQRAAELGCPGVWFWPLVGPVQGDTKFRDTPEALAAALAGYSGEVVWDVEPSSSASFSRRVVQDADAFLSAAVARVPESRLRRHRLTTFGTALVRSSGAAAAGPVRSWVADRWPGTVSVQAYLTAGSSDPARQLAGAYGARYMAALQARVAASLPGRVVDVDVGLHRLGGSQPLASVAWLVQLLAAVENASCGSGVVGVWSDAWTSRNARDPVEAINGQLETLRRGISAGALADLLASAEQLVKLNTR